MLACMRHRMIYWKGKRKKKGDPSCPRPSCGGCSCWRCAPVSCCWPYCPPGPISAIIPAIPTTAAPLIGAAPTPIGTGAAAIPTIPAAPNPPAGSVPSSSEPSSSSSRSFRPHAQRRRRERPAAPAGPRLRTAS